MNEEREELQFGSGNMERMGEGNIETIRHGHKEGEALSERGREEARARAREYLEQIRESAPGTVFFAVPSNVERAQETRGIIQREMMRLAKEEQDDSIVFVPVQDRATIEALKSEKEKRIVVTGVAPQSSIGLKMEQQWADAFIQYKKLYQGDEEAIGKTWVARENELEELRNDIGKAHPDVKADYIVPARFETTPEEKAIQHIRFLKRMSDITKKHMPGHNYKMLAVGHNIDSDFTALALMGKDISLKSVNEIGGKFRDFLESAEYRMTDDGIEVRFRGEETVIEKSFDDILSELEEKAEERKREWGVGGDTP